MLPAVPERRPQESGDAPIELSTGDAGASSPVPTRRTHRRLLVACLTLLLMASAVVVARPQGGEVVTTGPWYRHTGVTSTVAARDLSRELWRSALEFGPWDAPPWELIEVTPSYVVLSSGSGVATFDRSTGAHLASLPHRVRGLWGAWDGTGPFATTDEFVFADGPDVLTVDPATGAVTGRVGLDPPLPMGGSVGVLSGGDVLVISASTLQRVSPTGDVRWSVPVATEGGPPQVYLADDVLMVQFHDTFEVRELGSGTLRWRLDARAGPPPVVDEGRVFLINGGLVVRYDLDSGEEQWTIRGGSPLPEQILGVVGSDLVLAADGGRTLLRYDLATGERRDPPVELGGIVAADDEFGNSLLVGRTVIVRSLEEVQAVALGGGRTLWRAPAAGMVELPDDAIAVMDGSTVTVIDVASGKQRERVDLDVPPHPAGTALLGVAGRAVSLPGGVTVDLGTGEALGRLSASALEPWVRLQPWGDGFILEGRRPGTTSLIDPFGEVLWAIDGDDAAAGPAMVHGVVDGRLLTSGFGPTGSFLSLRDPGTGEELGARMPFPGRDIFAVGGDWAVAFDDGRGMFVGLTINGDAVVEGWRGASTGFGLPVLQRDEVVIQRVAGFERWALDGGDALLSAELPVVARAAAVGDGAFAYVTGDDRVLGVDPDTGRPMWDWQSPVGLSGSLTVAGDVAYVGTLDGMVHLIELSEGGHLSSVRAGEQPVSEVVVAHGVMLVVAGDEVVAFGPGADELHLPDLPPRQVGEVDLSRTGVAQPSGGPTRPSGETA